MCVLLADPLVRPSDFVVLDAVTQAGSCRMLLGVLASCLYQQLRRIKYVFITPRHPGTCHPLHTPPGMAAVMR